MNINKLNMRNVRKLTSRSHIYGISQSMNLMCDSAWRNLFHHIELKTSVHAWNKTKFCKQTKKITYMVFCLVISQIGVFAQTIKISNGLSVSSIKGKEIVFDLLSENRYDYSGFVGLNYWHHNYFYLSSEIGYASKGGKKKYMISRIENEMTRSVNYLHLNTTFRAKFPAKNYYFYAGIGPKVDFLIGNDVILSNNNWFGFIEKENPAPPSPSNGQIVSIPDNKESVRFKNYTLNKALFGLKPEIGFEYYFADKFMLGVNASYPINTGSIGKCHFSRMDNNELIQRDLYGRSFLFMLTFGYKL